MTLEEVTTLKEAIKRLKEVIKEVRSTIQPFLYDNEAKDYILKALEQESFINKPCVSSGVCEHDKNKVLNKIRAEIEELKPNNPNFKGYFEQNVALNKVLEVIDKHIAESENK